MAGERLAKLTLRADWSPSGVFTSYYYQTREVQLQLDGQWERFGNDAWSPVAGTGYTVPSPSNDPDFIKTGLTNLVTALRGVITARNLPYQVSDVRAAGASPGTGATMAEFDVSALDYLARYELDFQAVSSTNGWVVVQKLSTILPVTAEAQVQDAGIFGTATGVIVLVEKTYNRLPLSYVWADDPTQTTRQRLDVKAGTYLCTVTDALGASTLVRAVVKSDPPLLVAVRSTGTSITLVPSGGLPGYSYLWDDGSTLATRTGLTAGTYRCTVTDARGATRDVAVTLSAYQYYWSENPITLSLDAGAAYRADPTTKPNLSFLCQVWVEAEYLSENFTPVGVTLEQPADAQGRTTFQVQALLQPFLQHHVPAVDATAPEQATPLFRRFFLQHAEQFGLGTPVPAPSTSLERSYVVLGGLSFLESQARTWFTSYQPQVQPFLTWEPTRKAVLVDQPEYLYYMARNGVAAFRVQVRVQFTDGSEQVLELAGADDCRDFEVYCLPVGYAALGLASLSTPTQQVRAWDVQVAAPGGAPVLSEMRSFVLDTRVFPFRRYLLFATSLGGMATYVALGEVQTDAEVTGSESVLTLPPTYDPLQGDVAVQARALRPVIKLASGPRTQGQLVASQDLLRARRVLLLAGPRWLAGYLKAKTTPLLDESKRVPTQELEFILPTERLYTPAL